MTTAELEPLSVSVPLREDPQGVFRIGKSRVLLELVIRDFQRGQTPEAIVQSYDTLNLADVYAVVSYYLANPQPIDEYLRQRDKAAEEIRCKIEVSQPPRENLREVLMARARPRGWFVIKLATDENFDGDILRGLMRRQPDLDIVRVQDTEIYEAPDPSVLAWAASEQRILLTHDRETLPSFAYDRVKSGESMPGIFLVSDQMPKGQAIDQILIAAHCVSTDECKDQVIYFPL